MFYQLTLLQIMLLDWQHSQTATLPQHFCEVLDSCI